MRLFFVIICLLLVLSDEAARAVKGMIPDQTADQVAKKFRRLVSSSFSDDSRLEDDASGTNRPRPRPRHDFVTEGV